MLEELDECLKINLRNNTLLYLVLSRPKNRKADLIKITARPIKGPKGTFYQLTKQDTQKAYHSNHASDDLIKIIWPLLETSFGEAVFFTVESDIHVLINKRQKWTIMHKKPTRQNALQVHNRSKNYLLEGSEQVQFFVELGVMRKDGTLISKMANKYKQINKFVEIVADVAPSLKACEVLHIVDFGCGKSYLTFALYHYFKYILKRDVSIIGLDLKADVIAHCQHLAQTLGYTELKFQVGDINAHMPKQKIDMVVSLHACNTATDAALEKAIRWQADAILCVPCCQHELYNQIHNTSLTPLLKHGILKERFAALATDAARAQLLEISGYRTQVMEFIDMEHTPKNLLIKAVRGANKDSAKSLEQYQSFANLLSISPTLKSLLENSQSLTA